MVVSWHWLYHIFWFIRELKHITVITFLTHGWNLPPDNATTMAQLLGASPTSRCLHQASPRCQDTKMPRLISKWSAILHSYRLDIYIYIHIHIYIYMYIHALLQNPAFRSLISPSKSLVLGIFPAAAWAAWAARPLDAAKTPMRFPRILWKSSGPFHPSWMKGEISMIKSGSYRWG